MKIKNLSTSSSKIKTETDSKGVIDSVVAIKQKPETLREPALDSILKSVNNQLQILFLPNGKGGNGQLCEYNSVRFLKNVQNGPCNFVTVKSLF